MDFYKYKDLPAFSGVKHGFIPNFNPQDIGLLAKGSNLSAIRTVKQVHSDKILEISTENADELEGDSLYTVCRGVGVGVCTADCLPIIYFEEQRGIAGVIHAGWKGTLKKITAKTFTYLKEKLNCDSSNIQVLLGPCIEGKCYEIGEEVACQFMREFDCSEAFLTKKSGSKYYLDLKEANVSQLRSVGIVNINIMDVCTFCDVHLPSYRRDGNDAGRILSFIGLV